MNPIVGSAIGNTVGLVFQPISAWLGAQIEPGILYERYRAFARQKVVVPDPAYLFDAYNKNIISAESLKSGLNDHGIDWAEGGRLGFAPGQRLGLTEWRRFLWDNVRHAQEIRPDVSFALNLWTNGHINDDQLREMLKIAGADVADWMDLRKSLFTPLDVNALIVAWNRNIIDDVKFDTGLKHLGYNKEQTRNIIQRLAEVYPTVQDLVLFATRDLWDADVVRRRELFAEFPDGMRQWADALGLYGETNIPNHAGAAGANAQWADAYWGAHWQNIAPSQAFDMFHRLRPSRIQRYREQGLNVDVYDSDRLRQELKVSDYAKGDRDYLAAIAYTPMRLVDIRRALQLSYKANTNPAFAAAIDDDVLIRVRDYDRNWAVEQFLDRGLHPDDAGTSADIAMVGIQTEDSERMRKFEQSFTIRLARDIIEAYKTGTIGQDECERRLVSAGMSADGAHSARLAVDIEFNNSVVKSAVNGVRTDFFNGTLAPSELLAALHNAGMDPEAANGRITLWSIQRNRTRRTATTQQLLKWLEEGLINQADVVLRLTNLGWSNADQLTMLREAQQHIVQLRGRTLAAAQRTRAQQAKELQKVAKEASAVQKQAVLDLRSAMPRTSIQSWLRKGLVSSDYARARLLEQRWPLPSIDLWIQEALPQPPTPRNNTNGQTAPPASGNATPPV